MSDYTTSQQIADAKAEAYWATVERRNETRRAYNARPLCAECKTRRVENKPNAILCKTDADSYLATFGPEIYFSTFGQER